MAGGAEDSDVRLFLAKLTAAIRQNHNGTAVSARRLRTRSAQAARSPDQHQGKVSFGEMVGDLELVANAH